MSLEVFAFLFWFGVSLVAMQFVSTVVSSMLQSMRAHRTFGRPAAAGAALGALGGVLDSLTAAIGIVRESPRATLLALMMLGAGIHLQLASPTATMGAAMGLWTWMAWILPWAATRTGVLAKAASAKVRARLR